MQQIIALLPKMNDVMIATTVGVSKERVRQIRKREGIAIPEGLFHRWSKKLL